MIITLIAAALMVETAPTEEEKVKLQADTEMQAKIATAEEARQRVEAKAAMEAAQAKSVAEQKAVATARSAGAVQRNSHGSPQTNR